MIAKEQLEELVRLYDQFRGAFDPWAPEVLIRIVHRDEAEMGSTGYQPVPVGNLPTGRGRARCRRGHAAWASSRSHPSAGLVARRDGQVARATHSSMLQSLHATHAPDVPYPEFRRYAVQTCKDRLRKN
jgi:hypothetical protein